MIERFTSATFDHDRRIVQYRDATGKITCYSGGSPCWRYNNPGNLMAPVNSQHEPCPRLTQHWIGLAHTTGDHYYFIFPDYETGRGELKASLKRKYANKRLSEVFPVYAPVSDSNDPEAYLASVLSQTGLHDDMFIRDLSDPQLTSFMDAIERQEGYHLDEDTRKITTIETTSITISDSQRAIANAPLQVQRGEQTAIITSNSVGAFPLIPNPNDGEPLKISAQDIWGKWADLYTIEPGAPSKIIQVIHKKGEHLGISLSDQSAKDLKDDPPAFSYRVKPSDSLSKIASQFRTTVEKLKEINDLKGDTIYPEQMLWIYKKGGGDHPPVVIPPKPAKPKPKAATASSPKKTESSKPHAEAHKEAQAKPKTSDAASGSDGILDHVRHWLGMQGSDSSPSAPVTPPLSTAIAKDGHISPVDPQAGQAPWMSVAIREGIRYSGKVEKEITKTSNYHRLVTDDDRKGGRVVIDKNGNSHKVFDGAPTLSGDENAWCASFVNYCLVESSYPYAQKPPDAGAFTYAGNKDKFFKLKKPIYGALRVSKRTHGHHVCFVVGKVGSELLIIGGNQDDQILFEEITSHNLIGYYVPLLYKERAEKEEKDDTLAELDIKALTSYFGINLFKSKKQQQEELEAQKKGKNINPKANFTEG